MHPVSHFTRSIEHDEVCNADLTRLLQKTCLAACCAGGRRGATCGVWCPLTSGCSTGNGTFPYLGCQLKYQANLSSSAQPDAWERGPPTAFVSGANICYLVALSL